jgi:hypothetical protein
LNEDIIEYLRKKVHDKEIKKMSVLTEKKKKPSNSIFSNGNDDLNKKNHTYDNEGNLIEVK